MSGYAFAAVACVFALSDTPEAAFAHHHHEFGVPAPELDVGLLSLIMVGGAAGLAYWRKRNS